MNVNIIATGSKGNCYTIDDGKTYIMIDPGITFDKIQKAVKHRLSTFEACFVTHEHGDHIRGVKKVSEFVRVVSTPDTLNAINEKHNLYWQTLLTKMIPTMFGSLRVTAFPVKHNAVDPIGFHIKSLYSTEELVFITDSQFLKYAFPGVKNMVIECNYDEDILTENVENGSIEPFLANRIRANHYSIDTLIKTLERSPDVEKLWLIHNSGGNLDLTKAVAKIKGVYTGEIITYEKEMKDVC